MISIAEITGITGPIVSELMNDLGSTVTIRKKKEARTNADNSTTEQWTDAQCGVKCLIVDVDKAAAMKEWGRETEVTARGVVPYTAEAQERRGIIVTSGHYDCNRYEIEKTRPSELGRSVILGLKQVSVEDFE